MQCGPGRLDFLRAGGGVWAARGGVGGPAPPGANGPSSLGAAAPSPLPLARTKPPPATTSSMMMPMIHFLLITRLLHRLVEKAASVDSQSMDRMRNPFQRP